MSVSMLTRVQGILADVLSIPLREIAENSSPDTLEGWDSLRHLNLVLALEQDFAVQFMPEEIEQMLSPKIIGELLGKKLRSAGGSL
jgi:acyl carrier protein